MADPSVDIKTKDPKLFDLPSLLGSIATQFSPMFNPKVKQEDQSYQDWSARKLQALAGEKGKRETDAVMALKRKKGIIEKAKADALGLNNLIGASTNLGGNIGGAANVGAVLNKATPLKAQVSAQLSGQEVGAEDAYLQDMSGIFNSTAQATQASGIEKKYNLTAPELSLGKAAGDANLIYEGLTRKNGDSSNNGTDNEEESAGLLKPLFKGKEPDYEQGVPDIPPTWLGSSLTKGENTTNAPNNNVDMTKPSTIPGYLQPSENMQPSVQASPEQTAQSMFDIQGAKDRVQNDPKYAFQLYTQLKAKGQQVPDDILNVLRKHNMIFD